MTVKHKHNEIFYTLLPIILTDNDSEFSDLKA